MSTLSRQVVVLKSIGILLGVLMVAGLLHACRAEESTKTTSISARVLDGRVLALSQGASVPEIEAKLGEPTSKVTVGGETVLSYGLWRLVVEENHLKRRIRSRRPSHAGESGRVDREGKARDQKILAIRPGASIVDVRRVLGVPEHDEEVFEGMQHPEVVLGYGAWVLSFRSGELKQRTKF